jgi:hypothetical protein
MADRERAANAYVQALRTGEHSAVQQLAPYLAAAVVLATGTEEVAGADAVLGRVTGQWPNTPIYTQGTWTRPTPDGDQLKVSGTFPPLGASPAGLNLTFGFNAEGQISRVEQAVVPAKPATPTEVIPDFVRGLVNNALANGTPMCVAYVDEDAAPVLSLRGSVQVLGDTQLSLWIRNPEGGLARSLAKNPSISLLYRDQRTRSTLIFQGRAHFTTDEALRQYVFETSPEVEQNHDPGAKHGGALIVDVDRVQGLTIYGGVRMMRPAGS